MGLYDNYKLQNSQPISQYVGSAVPELMKSQQVLQERYDTAITASDKLRESLNAMTTLPFSADRRKGEELKAKLVANLDQYAKDGNYEDAVRKVQRDALQFTSEYAPLQKRYQDWSAFEKSVRENKGIINPETKEKILKVTAAMNEAAEPTVGPDGRITLGNIKTFAYADDVDVIDKIVKYANNMHAKTIQGNYKSNGQGRLVSRTIEELPAEEIQNAIKNLLTTDQSVKAMFERDYSLDSYGRDMGAFIQAQDMSYYDYYRKIKGEKKQDIESALMAIGMTPEDGKKTKIYQSQIQKFMDSGMDETRAKDLVAKNLYVASKMEPYLALAPDFEQYKSTIHSIDDPVWKEQQERARGLELLRASKDMDLNVMIDQPASIRSGADVESIREMGKTSKTALSDIETAMTQELAQAAGINLKLPTKENSAKIIQINKAVKEGMVNPAKFQEAVKSLFKGNEQLANKMLDRLNTNYRQKYQQAQNMAKMAETIESNIDREINFDYSAVQKEISQILGKNISVEQAKRMVVTGGVNDNELSFKSVLGDLLGFSMPATKWSAMQKNWVLMKARKDYAAKRDAALGSGKLNYGFKAIMPADASSPEGKVVASLTASMADNPTGRAVLDAITGQPLELTSIFGKDGNSKTKLQIKGVYPTMDRDASGNPIFLINGFDSSGESVSKPVAIPGNLGRIQIAILGKQLQQAANPDLAPEASAAQMDEIFRTNGAIKAPKHFLPHSLNAPGVTFDYMPFRTSSGIVDIEVKKEVLADGRSVFTVRDRPNSGTTTVKDIQKRRGLKQNLITVEDAEEIYSIFGRDLEGLVPNM